MGSRVNQQFNREEYLFGWLGVFYGISNLVSYSIPNTV